MYKPASNVRHSNRIERVFDRVDQRLDGPCLGTPQPRFNFRPALLNRVEIRRIGRQRNKPRAPRGIKLSTPATLWAERLSHSTMSPGRRVGHKTSPTQQ